MRIGVNGNQDMEIAATLARNPEGMGSTSLPFPVSIDGTANGDPWIQQTLKSEINDFEIQ